MRVSTYHQTFGSVNSHGKLSTPLVISRGLQREYAIMPLLFIFAIDDVICRSVEGLVDGDVEHLPEYKLMDLEYADVVFLASNVQAA